MKLKLPKVGDIWIETNSPDRIFYWNILNIVNGNIRAQHQKHHKSEISHLFTSSFYYLITSKTINWVPKI